MSRFQDIQDNKFTILLNIRDTRKNTQPRKESLVTRLIKRIIQFRLIGYIVIGISLFQLNKDINFIIFQMFLLILFTELNSRGVSKKGIDKLKEELNIQQEIHYEDRDRLEREGLLAQEKKDALKSKQDIEDNVRL